MRVSVGRSIRISILLSISALLAPSLAISEPSGISARSASQRAKQGRLLLIDVRAPKEWRETGIPAHAVPITKHQPLESFLAQVHRAANGSKARPIALICGVGVRSREMAEALEMDGYLNVSNIDEGLNGSSTGPGWISAGLPMRQVVKRRE